MGIFGFLFGLGCLVVIAWAIAILGGLVFGRKHRQPDQRHEQPSPMPTELEERKSPQPTITAPSTPAVPRRRVVALSLPPTSTRVRLRSSRNQQYIRLADVVLNSDLAPNGKARFLSSPIFSRAIA